MPRGRMMAWYRFTSGGMAAMATACVGYGGDLHHGLGVYAAGAAGLDVDVARVEAAYGYAVLAGLYGGGMGEADDAELGGGVGGGVGTGHLGGCAADVDYAASAARHHDSHGLAAAEEYAGEVDFQDALPSLEGELVEGAAGLYAGVVDGDVDAPEAFWRRGRRGRRPGPRR